MRDLHRRPFYIYWSFLNNLFLIILSLSSQFHQNHFYHLILPVILMNLLLTLGDVQPGQSTTSLSNTTFFLWGKRDKINNAKTWSINLTYHSKWTVALTLFSAMNINNVKQNTGHYKTGKPAKQLHEHVMQNNKFIKHSTQIKNTITNPKTNKHDRQWTFKCWTC